MPSSPPSAPDAQHDPRPEARIRPLEPGGDPYGTHRVIAPAGSLPQPAEALNNDFRSLYAGEVLVAVDTLNIDAASFAQMCKAADVNAATPTRTVSESDAAASVAAAVLRTVSMRGKQHNPVTGSGGMLLGRVLQIAPGRPVESLSPGDRIATLVSLTLTPLRIDRVRAVRLSSGQLDIDGEAVFFASSAYAALPLDLGERLALAVLDVAGAAPQVARMVRAGGRVVVLGAGGKSGILCAAEARRTGGDSARVIGLEANAVAAAELRALGICDAVVLVDARDPLAVRRAVLDSGGEADVVFSCVNVPDAELGAIFAARERGAVYFFAMSTSFAKAALGAEGVGKDVDLFIGNGFARGHAEHTLAMIRDMPRVRALFEKRYG